MLGALDLLFALGRDDLRVVRYCSSESDRIISSWGRPSVEHAKLVYL